jgi:predicted nucleic-acid-binding protein
MIGVDTNVLVRAILGDDPKQSPLARRAIEKARDVLVPVTVVIEVAWVLKSVGWNRAQIHEALSTLAMQPTVHIDRASEVLAALDAYRVGPADFADYLVLFQAKSLGAQKLLTFDRKLAKAPGAERLV